MANNKLPQQLSLQMMQNRWGTILGPIVDNPLNNSIILKDIALTTGTNVINHKLGRKLQGWFPTRVRADATLYDQQDSNQMQDLTLVLVTSADVTIDLVVF